MDEGIQLERIYLLTGARGEPIDRLTETAHENGVPVNRVPAEKLKSFNLERPEDCIGVRSRIHYLPLQDVISFIVEKGEAPLLVILDGITDVRNIGAIARSAWSCNAHAIILPEKGVGALQEDAVTTSAGALEHILVSRVRSIPQAIDELHLNGIQVFASDMNAPVKIFDLDFKIPCAIIFGSEDKGVHPTFYKMCDQVFCIPMQNHFESLNVSVAVGMTLYEAMKQRMQG